MFPKKFFFNLIFAFIVTMAVTLPVLAEPWASVDTMGDELGWNDMYDNDGTVYVTLSHSEDAVEAKISWDGTSSSSPGTWQSISVSKTSANHDYNSDGKKYCHYKVKDSSNVWSSVDYNYITVDRLPPQTIFSFGFGTEEGDNGWYKYLEVELDAVDATSGVDYTKYRINSGSWQNYYWSFYVPQGQSQMVYFYSVDEAGNTESPKQEGPFKIDYSPPVTQCSLSGTVGENGWYVSPVSVSLSAQDNVSGADWIKYKIGFFGEEMVYSSPFTLSEDGEYTIYYWAKDIAGNGELERSIDVKIDTTEPNTPVIDEEKIDDYTRGDSITIFWSSVFDPTSDNVRYFVQCDDNEDFSSPYAESGWITGTSYTFSGLEDETKYWYRVKAKDGAGNESEWSDDVSSIQDATDPRIIITAPDDGFSSDEYKVSTATVTLSDNLWCYRMSGNVNGDPTKVKPWSSGDDSVITSTYVIVNLEIQEGMNDITLTVEDRAGNSTSKTIQVTYGIYTTTNFKFHYTTSATYPIRITYNLGGRVIGYVGRDDHVDNTDRDGNRIPDYVDDYSENSFARIFENVWNFETGFMGRQPINGYYDYSTGAVMNSPPGSEYNIYIINVGANSIYGFARPLPSSGASYMAVDNDYAEFSGSQSDNMKVTAAHEFFHAIQFAIDVDEDHWWMEATAVWMEDEVYKYGRDITSEGSSYLQYFKDTYDMYGNLVAGWFKRPETSLDFADRWHEYGSVIFAKYLSENYGPGIIKTIWDGCAGSTTQSLDAIQNALSTHGELEDNFKTFTYWNYDKEKRYDEGSLYAPYPTKIEFSHYNYPLTRSEEIDHLASNYIEFLPDPRIPTDATTTQNLHIEISTTTALWGGKVLKVDRAGEVIDVVNLASGDEMDIKGLGSNSTDKYSKIILVLSNTNTGGRAEPYAYDAFASAVKYDSDRVLDPLRSGTSPKIYAKMVQDGLYSSESGESYSEDSEDVDDWFGNDDGNIDAGELPNIKVTLKNLGSVEIVNATAIITPDSQSSEYIDFSIFNEDSYPDTMVPYGGTAEGWRGYWGSVSADTPLGQDLYFTLDITDQYGINYDDKFTINDVDLDIHPRFPSYFTNDGNNLENGEWGNNNGDADAGELLAVPISLFNDGYSNIRKDGYYQDMGLHDKYNHCLVATLSTTDSYVKRIFDDSEKFEDILSYLSGQTLGNYNFLIRSSAPPGDSISFTLAIRDVVTDVDGNSHIYDWEDQFDVAVTGGDTVPPLIGGVDIVNVPDVPILKEGDKVKFTTDILDGSDKVSRKVNILYPDNSVHTVDVDKTSPVWNGYYERIIDYWQLPLSTGTLQDGTYTIQSLEADDGYGNVSSTETNKNIEIDTELPVTILNELANKYISGQAEIIGTAKDVHLSRYRLYYAPGENLDPDDTSINWTLIAESDSSVENSTLGIWDTTLVTGGPYTLKLWAEDEVLHTNQDTLNVIVDNTPPEISNAYASPFVFTPEDRDGFRDITTLYGSISDNLSPEFTFQVKIVEREEGAIVANLADETTQAKNFSFIWNGKNEVGEFVQDGLYYFNITGIDLAGNESTVNVPVTKNRAPSRIDSPEEEAEVGDIVDISGLAVDYVDFKNFILDYASGSFDISNEEEASWMAIPVPVINQAKADPNYPYSNISVIQCNEGILANWNTIGLDDGEYTIRLKVNDYAGDIQKVFRHVMVKNPLYLYNVSPSNEVFSPNGDGIQDTVVVKYALSEEADVSVEVLDSSRTIRKSYFTEKNLPKGEHTITWDGKDNGGEIVEDGKYEIKIVADAIAPDGGKKEAIESIIVNNFQRVPDLTADISSPAEGSDVQTNLGIHYTWEAEGTGRKYPDQKFDYIITAVGTEMLPAGGDNTEKVHLHKSWSIFHHSKWGSFNIYLSNPEEYRNRGPVQWQREIIKSEHVEYVRHTAYDDHLRVYVKVYSNFWGDGCYIADYRVWAPEKQISWTRSQSGTGKVNALEGEKLIAECNLTAPNNDTRWFLWHNNSNVGAWMKDNKLYATTGVSELWSTVKVPGGDNIFELSVSSRTEKIEYIPPMSNVRIDRWKVKLLDGEGNENKDIVVESIDFSNGTFVTKLEGNPAPRSLVKIEGTAASPNLEYYRVESGPSDDIYSWTTIKESNRQVINGTLVAWDVTDLKEGAYVVLLTVVDKGGDVKQVYKRVNLNIPLIITYEEPNPNPFSPQYEETKLKFNLSEEARVTVKIKKDITTVKELVSEKLMKFGSNELKWDGRDTEGNIVPDGIYSCEIMATDTDLDIDGNPLEQASAFIPNIQVKFLNKKLEPLNLTTKPNPFSPDGDGVKDSANITYNLSERANVRLLIRNSGEIVRTLLDVEEPQGLRSVDWDGKLADGTTIVSAGKYTCWIEATSLDDSSDVRRESVELTLQGASTGNITAQILEPTIDEVVDRTSSNAGTFFTYEAEGTGTKYPEQAFSYTINAIGAEEINAARDRPVYHNYAESEYAYPPSRLTDGELTFFAFYVEHKNLPLQWRWIEIPFKGSALITEIKFLGAELWGFYYWPSVTVSRFRIDLHTLDGWKTVHSKSSGSDDLEHFSLSEPIKITPTYADKIKIWIRTGFTGDLKFTYPYTGYFRAFEIEVIGHWSGSQSGSGEVSAVNEHKYITTSTLRAPNSDTSWTVTDNSDKVITWMNGNKLYARVDTTKPGTVIPNWSTGKIYSKNPNLLIFDPNNPDVVPSLHLNVFDVYTRPSDVEFESWQITPLNVDGSVNTDVTIENIDAVNGTFDAKLNLKEQRKFLQIGGTAAGGDFKSYTIEYGQGSEPDEWTLIKTLVGPVTDATLAYWDISRLYGSYTLLLTVEDTSGNVKELKRNIQIGELVTQGISDFAATPYEETHLYFSPDTLPISIEDDYPLTPEKDALVSAIPIAPENVPDDPNIVIVGPVFDFKPSGLTFNENFPVTLNSQYTIERLQEMLGDVDPSKLGIYQFYPDGTVEYRPSFVDKETQMVAITAQIPHFSQYIMALDLTPPVVPVLDPIESPTNQRLVKVTGRAQPEATIEIFTNGKSQGKVSTDNEGKFSLAVVEIEEGDNLITAIATNKKGISSDAATASMRLDRLTPVLLAVDVSPGIFSPNGDGVDDAVSFIAKLSEPGSVNYTIFDSSGRVVLVRNLETEDEDITYFSWDGLTSGGERASDGVYSYHISGIDFAGNKATENSLSNGIIKLDTTSPEILNVSSHPLSFSPDGDGVQDEVSIDYEIKDNLCSSYYLTVRIYDESGNLVRLLKNREPLPLGANRVVWDGSDEIGNIVNDGNYTVRLDFVDVAANQGKEVSITVKLDNASVLDFSKIKVEPESFSPDDNGKQDTCSISYTLLSPGKVTLKIVTPELMTPIKDLIVDRDLDTGSYIMSWDGKDDEGNIVADGIYGYKLSAISQAGKESQVTLFVNVDNTPPVAKISQPSSDATLNGTIDIEGTVSDENYSGYSLTYGQGTSPESWTLLFSSSEPVTGSSLASWDTAGLSGTYSIRLRVVDDAGNQAEDKVSFNLDNSEKYIIRLLPTSSNLFSPNGDGVKDELSIIYFLEEDALMGLWVYDENNMLRTLLDGTTLQTSGYNGVRWDGRGDSGDPLPDGAYSYTLQAESVSEGFKDERLGNAIIDTLSPTVSITSPKPGDAVGGTIGIFGTANDIAFSGYRMEYGSGDSPQEWKEIKISANPVTDGLLSYFDTSGLDNGNYMLRLTAEDRAGNQDIAKVSLSVNNSPIVARIETPVWGEILGGEIRVFGTAQAPALDYYQLEYSTDSLTYQPVTGKINTAVNVSLLATWDTSGINGSCSLRLSVQDKSGRSRSISVSIKIDNTSPAVEIKSPKESATIWGTISIIGTVSDENLERYSLEYRNATSNDSWQAIGTYMAPINDATLGFWNTEGLNGDYLIKVKAIDKANNTSEVVTRVTIDNILPVARIDEPENNSVLKGKVNITGGASDSYFDKYTVTYAQGPSFGEWESILISTVPVTNGILARWDTTPLNGTYSVKLRIYNRKGKVNEDKIVVFVDNTAPIISGVSTNPSIFDPNNSKANFTTISYTLSEDAKVTLSIRDGDGRLMRQLISSSLKVKGTNSSVWDGKDDSRATVAYGDYIYEIEASDLAGNLADKIEGTIKLSLDLPPATVITPSGPIYSDGRGNFAPMSYTYTLIGINTDDVSQVNYIQFNLDNGGWETYTSPLSFTNEGEHSIMYKSVDTNSNWEDAKEFRVIVDSTPPESHIQISPPQWQEMGSGVLYVGSSTKFTLSAIDGGTIPSGVLKREYRINEGDWQEYTGSFNLEVVDGSYTIEYRAIDNVRNVEDNKSLQVILDSSPPASSVVVSEPRYSDDKAIWISSSTLVSLFAEDGSGSGVKFTQYKIDSGNEETYTGPFALISEGSHVITYRSEDNLGNTETAKSIMLLVDRSPPTADISIWVPKYGTEPVYVSSQTAITLTGQDGAGCGIDKIQYSLDKGETWMVYTSSFTITQNGMVSIQYKSMDRVKNAGEIKTINIFVDNMPPVTTFVPSEPLYEGLYALYAPLSTTYSLSGEDPLISGSASGMAKVEYKIDDGELMEYDEPFPLPAGEHIITYYGTDNVANIEEVRPFEVIVDTTSPHTDVIPSGKLYNDGTNDFAPLFYTYVLKAVQGLSGVDHIEFSVDGGNWEIYSNPISFSTGGEHSIRYRAVSNTGNLEKEKEFFKVIVDGKPPEVVVLFPADGAYIKAPLLEAVKVKFSEYVSSSSSNGWRDGLLIKEEKSGNLVSGTFAYDSKEDLLTFTSSLKDHTVYNIKLTSEIKDKVGNPLKEFSSSFTTLMLKEEGGKVEEGEVSLEIPPNGLPQDAVIIISKEEDEIVNKIPRPFQSFEKDTLYHIVAYNQDHQEIQQKLNKPMGMKISYGKENKSQMKDSSKVEKNSVNPKTLKLYWYNPEKERWELVKNSKNNFSVEEVMAQVERFGRYSLMGFIPFGDSLEGLTNYPNPFPAFGKDYTTIQYYLKDDADVAIAIYDLMGNLVKIFEIDSGEEGGRGGELNKVEWDGRNGRGDMVANGGYICRVQIDDGKRVKSKIRKILVIK